MNNFVKKISTMLVLISLCSGGLIACKEKPQDKPDNSTKVEQDLEENKEAEESKKPEVKPEENYKKPQENKEEQEEIIIFEKVRSLTAVVTAKSLNVRKEPDINSQKVNTLIKDTIIVVTQKTSNGWYLVMLDGKELGFVSTQYVKFQNEFTRYLIKDVKVNDSMVIKKGEKIKVIGVINNMLEGKYKDVTFPIDTNSMSVNKPVEKQVEKPVIKEENVIGSYTTYYDANVKGRSENIRLASKAICINLKKGEEFVWSKVVGQASSDKGYKQAPVFSGGQVVQGVGGGVCQVSTTLYNAALDAGLKITERHQHSMPVSYVPAGKDATVAYGSLDFRFINTSDSTIKIVGNANNGTLTVKILKL